MITLLLLVRATYMYGVVLHAHPVVSAQPKVPCCGRFILTVQFGEVD